MAHRAKHLRRNWTPEREAASHRGRGPATTAATTGLAVALRANPAKRRVLAVVGYLARARQALVGPNQGGTGWVNPTVGQDGMAV